MDYPQRKRNRLRDYDYAENGAYFITICTENKKCCLSEIRLIHTEAQVALTRRGSIVERFIKEIPMKYPTVSVDHYVIMPNHVHLLLRFDRFYGTGNPSPTENGGTGNPSPTVGNVIGWFKYQTTKAVNESETGKASFWQRSYYDHVIRDDRDYVIRWRYIDGNPPRWAKDEYYKEED